MNAKIEYIVESLLQIWGSQHRLQNALDRRKIMMETIRSGKEPDCHRSKFIRDTAKVMIEYLIDSANQFDLDYPDDRCLVADIFDILRTVQHRFDPPKKKEQQNGDEQPNNPTSG